jgi:hypothetical protein
LSFERIEKCGEYLTAFKDYSEFVRKKINLKAYTKCMKKEHGLIQKVYMPLTQKYAICTKA